MSSDDVRRRPGMSRRQLLAAGGSAVGATIATAVLGAGPAMAAGPGGRRLAPQDLAADPAGAIQSAIDAASAAGGGTVMLPAGEFELAATLHLRTGVTVAGAGMGRTVLRDSGDLGVQPIFLITGTPDARVRGVGLTDLTIRNGTATTGKAAAPTVDTLLNTVGKDGIYAEYASGVRLRRVEITEIEGVDGFGCKATTDVTCTQSRFYRCTYSMFMVGTESENFLVSDNVMDTLTSTAYPNVYTFATGGNIVGQGEFYPRNLTVRRNRISNNPLWLGLNTHGGQKISFLDNYVENVKDGIFVALDDRWGKGPVLQDIVVSGNTFTMSPDVPSTAVVTGITASGSVDVPARNIEISNNTFLGFDRGHPWDGAITVKNAVNVDVRGNLVDGYSTYGVNLVTAVYGARVRGNRIRNMTAAYPGAEAVTAGITGAFAGCYGIEAHGNVIDADDPSRLPAHVVYTGTPFASWQISDNRGSVAGDDFAVADYLPAGRDETPTDYLTQQGGDLIYRSDGRPGWRATAPREGFGSLDTDSTIVYVDVDAGSAVAHITANGAGDWRCIPNGMNIVIAGAGADGADLRARAVDVAGVVQFKDYSAEPTETTQIVLDVAAAATVRRAAVTYQGLVLRPLGAPARL